jgi:Na+-driven multidrug efflux pump
MSISVGFNWLVLVPGVLIMVLVLHTSALAVWIYITVYLLLESQGLFWRFRCGAWKRIKLIERPAKPTPEDAGAATVMDMDVEL